MLPTSGVAGATVRGETSLRAILVHSYGIHSRRGLQLVEADKSAAGVMLSVQDMSSRVFMFERMCIVF